MDGRSGHITKCLDELDPSRSYQVELDFTKEKVNVFGSSLRCSEDTIGDELWSRVAFIITSDYLFDVNKVCDTACRSMQHCMP
jgi:hypothetical protein